MPAVLENPPAVRVLTREALLRKRRGWFFGLTGDQFVKYVFQGNAAISIIVLALITFTIFRDAVGFLPQNQGNLRIYREAGLELVDLLREQVKDHSAISRYLASIRSSELNNLTKAQGLPPAQAQAKLAGFDDFANRFADTIGEHETILGTMGDLASSLKERHKVADDLREAKQNLLNAMPTATAERRVTLQKELDDIKIEQIDFKTEIKPLLAMRADVVAANAKLIPAMQELAAHPPQLVDPALQGKIGKFQDFVAQYVKSVGVTAQRMADWDQSKPVGWTESFTAFAFGREWVTASFWQDWYGVIPLFTGSLLIAFLALLLAIPLGVAAAIYLNQVARPTEQKIIKPYIEFISAIPSVVLGFFGIAMLGETLRRVSQIPSLHWVPGFPIAERLNATTAACLLALMAIPTIFSLAEDAINNVPRSFREASLALGATRLQTIVHITVPAALSGIMAAILLGFGRVIGETMVVLLCAGNRIQIPDLSSGLGVIFQPVHTMTGIIAQEMGEVVRDSIHYRALFMVGVLLFLISLLINWLAQKIVRRYPHFRRMNTSTSNFLFARPTFAKRAEKGVFWLLRLSTYFVLFCAAFIFYDIGSKGGPVIFRTKAPFINIPFLTESPETLNVFDYQGKKVTMGDREFRQFKAQHETELKGVHVDAYVYSAGGIFPNIVGTVLLVAGSILIALILGVLSAIYLSEYATEGPFIRFLRLSIVNLAGVPSIVFGLFGFGMFVIALDFGVSLLAGWLTLAFMVLPIIITASEEALKAVPKGYREGSLALGATKFQTIMTNVLPYALPGILTSSVLSIARVAGETAPIMFTAAFVVRDELPWQVQHWMDFFFQGVMALPYHIYVVASKIPQNEYTRDVQYGTAFVFLFTVAAIAMTAVVLRTRLRKKYKW